MEITFCCTNIDLYTLEEVSELERLGLPLHVEHCLGLCHYCAQGKLALINATVVVADSPEAFWRALRSCFPAAGDFAKLDSLVIHGEKRHEGEPM